MSKKFLTTREKREARELHDAALRASMLACVKETAMMNSIPWKDRDDSAISGSTRHKATQRCVDLSPVPTSRYRLRCKSTNRASSQGLPRNA